MKRFYGKYATEAEAREVMGDLYKQGYTRGDIKIISNHVSDGSEDHNKDGESVWEKIKDTFNPDDGHDRTYEKHLEDDERKEVAGYETHLQAGEVVLLVEEKAGHPHEDKTNHLHEENVNHDLLENERKMELKKERLNVDKEEVYKDEIGVKKVIKKETETIEVPIEKEEIVIERKSAGGDKITDEEIGANPLKNEDEIRIPIKEERVNVNKETVVDDEVTISKEKHTENKRFTEEIKHEDIEVEGDTKLNEGLKDKNRRSEDI